MRSRCVAMICALLAGGFMSVAHAETLGFDDIAAPGNNSAVVLGTYHGFTFNNFDALDGTTFENGVNNGYTNGVVSPDNVIFNGWGAPASFSSTDASTFTLNSMYLTAAWNNGLQITVTGYDGGTLLDTATFTVNESGPTLETLNWSGVNTIEFVSRGGTPVPGVIGMGTQFALDNLTVSSVASTPEPCSLLLLGTSLLGGLGIGRRRLTRS